MTLPTDPKLLTREEKILALQKAEKEAQLADGKSLLDATAEATKEATYYEKMSDLWIDHEYRRHVLGETKLELLDGY